MSFSKPKKIFQDSIHGIIELEPIMMHFVDTPEFQRLRKLHQLGLSFYVYPDCTHDRFEHCLGTYHLAKRLIDAIQADPNCADVHLSVGERASVLIAALCHDLGHGPFSHTWERFLKQGGPDYKNIKHEDMSCLILKRIVAKDERLQELLIDVGADLDLVCALISGNPAPTLLEKFRKKKFIFEIVSNSLNGNDVDKWDYIMRDCLHAGLGQGSNIIEVERMLHFYRPTYYAPEDTWHMAFRTSEIVNVLHIFSQRLLLHYKVYSHKTVCALEAMFIDIFEGLDSNMRFRDLSLQAAGGNDDALDAFLRLDDYFLLTLASSQLPWPHTTSPMIKEKLCNSANLFRRIEFRQLYSFVGKFYVFRKSRFANGHCPPDKYGISDLSRFAEVALFEAEDRLRDAIFEERLGSKAQNLAEIFKKLPPDSPVKSVDELRFVVAAQSSNSTDNEAIFFAYNALSTAFPVKRAHPKVRCWFLFWTGPPWEGCSTDRALRGPKPAPCCLVNALNSWLDEKRC